MDSLRKLMDLVEGAQSTTPSYNLQTKYDQFNRAYFKGELPAITLRWASLKTVGGVVQAKIKRTSPPDRRMVRMGKKNHNAEIVPGSMSLTLSTLFKRTDEELDGILLHEMIHVYFYHIGDLDEGHDWKFMKELRRVSQESGIKVPRKDNTENKELTKEVLKAVGIMLIQNNDGSYAFSIVSPKVAHDDMKARETWTQRRLYKSATIYTIATPAWSKASMNYAIGRTFKNFYNLRDQALIDDLLTNGRKLWEFMPPPRGA